MKYLILISILIQQLIIAEGLYLTNGRFAVKDFGPKTELPLNSDQIKVLDEAIPTDKLGTDIKLDQQQIDIIKKAVGLSIREIHVFESSKGYPDCTCFGVPSNIGSRFNKQNVELPHCFIQDELMAQSEEAGRAWRYLPLDSKKQKKIKSFTYNLEGHIGNLPVMFELNVKQDNISFMKGHYTYLDGNLKNQRYEILAKPIKDKTFHLREYKSSEDFKEHTADIYLRRKKNLLSKEKWSGIMKNVDGKEFNVELKITSKKLLK